MAKDPAVLFYTSDFLSGTFTMTHEQVGKYIRLLCLQHQKGVLSEKDMINVCGTYDEDVFSKFEKSGKTFFNKRMKEEADKRQSFCESRRKSRQGSKNQTNNQNTYVPRMENVNENVNENAIEDDNGTVNKDFGKSENLLIVPEMLKTFQAHNPKYPASKDKDYRPLFSIANYLCEIGKLPGSPDQHRDKILEAWEPICKVIKADKFYSQKTLSTISNHIQEILQISLNGNSKTRPAGPTKEGLNAKFAERFRNKEQGSGNGHHAGV